MIGTQPDIKTLDAASLHPPPTPSPPQLQLHGEEDSVRTHLVRSGYVGEGNASMCCLPPSVHIIFRADRCAIDFPSSSKLTEVETGLDRC